MNATLLLRLSLAIFLLAARPVALEGAPPLVVKSLADSGPHTLRSAVEQANALPGENLIIFVVEGEVNLLAPLPAIVETLTIDANVRSVVINGALIPEDSAGPLIDIPSGAILNLDGLVFEAARYGALRSAGEVYVMNCQFNRNTTYWDGGAITSSGTLTLKDTVFSANHADSLGGALYNTGTLIMHAVNFESNSSQYDGGAIYNTGLLEGVLVEFADNESIEYDFGGALLNMGHARLEQSLFTGNRAFNGGGAISNTDVVRLVNVVFSNNDAKWGGAILNLSGGRADVTGGSFVGNIGGSHFGGAVENYGTLTLSRVLLRDNWAYEYGGAVSNWGEVYITSSTFEHNHADIGGALMNWGGGSMHIAFTTLAGNFAPNGGGALWNDTGATLDITHSIAAYSLQGGNCAGQATSGAMNISDEDSCAPGFIVVDPLLGPLADNGGPTLTRLLLPGSPAIDSHLAGTCSDPLDQRLVPRPQGLGCDAGAVEVEQIKLPIDVVPKSTLNSIDPSRLARVSVAILSTAEFNAPRLVSAASLTFGRSGWEDSLYRTAAGRPACGASRVNGDTYPDLLCSFTGQKTGLQCGDVHAILRGQTTSGGMIVGSDAVQVICR